MSDEPGFVEEWLARLTRAKGIAAIQVLDVRTGAVLTPRGQASTESAEDARARSAAVERCLTAAGAADEAEASTALEAVPPAWRGRLRRDDYALYQARVGRNRILEALVSRESQDVADLLDATVERLETHFGER